MKRLFIALGIGFVFSLCFPIQGHDVITTKITFSREISRIFYERCASCHRDGGSAFSLMTYPDVRPWAVAIKEEVLSRRMPPWGAIKGFGEFRNDQALTPEQLELITQWVEGGVPEGEAVDLPPLPKLSEALSAGQVEGALTVSGDFALTRGFRLDGIFPQKVADNESAQIMAELPNGSVEPLLWLYEYKASYGHPFLFRSPIELPRGTTIRGVPPDSSVVLLPPGPTPAGEAQNAR
ncbi:MAG TPA: cytochrome c [Terriglobia bacterium]|nr:cytochrome c [Terriglobia bacterium]